MVGRSVGRSHFTFFYDFISLTSLLLPKWSGDLKYGPYPPARDFGSRVSGLVLSILSFGFQQDAVFYLQIFQHLIHGRLAAIQPYLEKDFRPE